jgi:hypothetical protein
VTSLSPHGRYEPLVNLLVTEAGGYLNNTVLQSGLTCRTCRTPVTGGWPRCYPCNEQLRQFSSGLADHTAFLTYAIEGAQSAFTMYRYKDETPSETPHRIVTLLTLTGLLLHTECLNRVAGLPVTAWVAVPSLRGRLNTHPLRNILAPFTPGQEIPATPRITTGSRNTDAGLFHMPRLPSGSHVLVIDDTWASGSHAQSMALSARAAGAERISVLIVARWIKPEFAENRRFITEHLNKLYDPRVCPWDTSACQLI